MKHNKNINIVFSILIILGLAFSLSPVKTAEATGHSTYYVVSSIGNDTTCDGKSATVTSSSVCPFATIEHAIAAAASSDTIRVSIGSYTNVEFNPWTWTGKNLSFIFEDGVVLDNMGDGCFLIQTDYNRFTSVVPGQASCRLDQSHGQAGTAAIGFEIASGVKDIVIDGMNIYGKGNWQFGYDQEGITFDGSNSNIQVVNSNIHNLGADINFVSTPTGVIDIQGNNFYNSLYTVKAPEGSAFSLKYNSWGSYSGPNSQGYGTVGFDTSLLQNWTFAALSIESTNNANEVVLNNNITFTFSMSARRVLGLDFAITFDPTVLEYVSSDLSNSVFSSEKSVNATDASTGRIKFHGLGQTIEGTPYQPISSYSTEVFNVTFKGKAVNTYNIGITDPNDVRVAMDQDNGPSNWIYINNFPTYSDNSGTVLPNYKTVIGTVSMQGRVDRDGAIVKLWQNADEKYSNTSINRMTNNVSLTDVTFGTYVISIIKDGYLDINKTMARSMTISTSAYTITTLELKGGDANDDDSITIADATLIGNDYGQTTSFTDFTDINSSGKVDIFDLALMGGNYGMTSFDDVVDTVPAYTSWTAQ